MKIELVEDGKCPKRMTDGAAGYDVFARKIEPLGFNEAKIWLGFKIDCSFEHDALSAGEFNFVDTPVHCEQLPMNFTTLLLPRSGWGKYGFGFKNTTGVIDPDYRGEVMAMVRWDSGEDLITNDILKVGARIGQLLLVPCYVGSFEVVDALSDTERGNGGFGSTGDK